MTEVLGWKGLVDPTRAARAYKGSLVQTGDKQVTLAMANRLWASNLLPIKPGLYRKRRAKLRRATSHARFHARVQGGREHQWVGCQQYQRPYQRDCERRAIERGHIDGADQRCLLSGPLVKHF